MATESFAIRDDRPSPPTLALRHSDAPEMRPHASRGSMRRVSFRSGLLALAGTAAMTQIASAADLPAKTPMTYSAPAYSWTGFYLGGNAGWLGQG